VKYWEIIADNLSAAGCRAQIADAISKREVFIGMKSLAAS